MRTRRCRRLHSSRTSTPRRVCVLRLGHLGGVAISLGLLLPSLAGAQPSMQPTEPPSPGVYSPAEGVPGAPSGSCAAQPEQARCPTVGKIVVSPTTEGLVSGYGPTAGSGGPKYEAAASATNGNICGVHSEYPNVTVNNRAHGHGENECLPGYGVQYSELWIELDKYQADGSLQYRGTEYSGRRTGAGLTVVDRYSECFGRTAFNWRAFAYAYSVINGVGYFGSNQHIRSMPCN